MKLDQIAYYAHNEEQEDEIKNILGLQYEDWVYDKVIGKVKVSSPGPNGRPIVRKGRSTANLQFCYKYGIELEILTYTDGPNWHDSYEFFSAKKIFISHHGYHLDDGEKMPDKVPGFFLAQEMWTEVHTNPYLIEKRRTYHYRIFDSYSFAVPAMKFIKRIEK